MTKGPNDCNILCKEGSMTSSLDNLTIILLLLSYTYNIVNVHVRALILLQAGRSAMSYGVGTPLVSIF